jgi:NDP-sugar pyrophosphorylase family protein
VILAGGLGTRLRSIVSDRPKALAPIGEQPFLEIQIGLLRDQGARRFVLCVGHRAEQVQNVLGDGTRLGVRIEYSVEREVLLGTGGALRLAGPFIDSHALVLNGDTYLAEDYRKILERHFAERSAWNVVATLTLARHEGAHRFGTVQLDSTERFVSGFHEKAQSPATCGYLNAGAYVVERELIEWIPAGRPCSLEREVFPNALASSARIASFPSSQQFFDIGTPGDFQRFDGLYRAWSEERLEPAISRNAALIRERDPAQSAAGSRAPRRPRRC